MHVGYFVDPLHPAGSDFTKTIHDDLNQIATLDKLGFTEAWVAEHFTMAWENIPSPELFIAQALAMTENIKLCTGVTCLPNHNPFHLAHSIAQLDHQAKGRFMWGVGSGASPHDFKAFDIDPSELQERTWQTLDMVLKIWDGLEPGTYENKYWKFTMPEAMDDVGFRVHMKPYQKPHPPIGAGGLSPRSDTLRRAGEHGWMPLSVDFVPTSSLITHWEVYEEGARSAGRVPNRADWRICRHVLIADTTEEAREIAMTGAMARDFEVYVRNLLHTLGFLGLVKTDPDIPDEDIDAEYMIDNVWIVGSAEEVAAKLRKLHDDTGGFGTLIAWSHEWEPYDKWVNSMTVLAKEVIPSLSDLTP